MRAIAAAGGRLGREERLADRRDGAVPVGLGDLEERLLRLLAGAGDGGVERRALLERRAHGVAGRARDAGDRDPGHQYFPTTKPPSTRR